MKKLILSAAILLGGLTAVNAQTEKEPGAMTTQKETVAVETTTKAQTMDAVATPQEYKEVKVADVPQEVQTALATDMKGAKISKAYVNESGEYKLDLATADKKTKTVYANAKGEWIKKEKEMKKQ